MHKFKMPRRVSQGLVLALALGCGGRGKPAAAPGSAPPVEASPLSGLVAQQLLITPTQRARAAAELNWTGVPKSADLAAAVDTAITTTLHARDALRNWVFGDGLMLNFTRNPTYLTDPRALAIEPLAGRGPLIPPGTRLTEPLASQLRTMIALHDARLVMIPVEFRIESAGSPAGAGRAVLRLVLVDPRSSDIKWMAEIKGDPAPAYSPAIITSVATRVANLFIAP
jgi:hypothetical protein